MSNERRQPSKPTQPFGYLEFSKNKKARTVMASLSREKPVQEREAFERFSETYNLLRSPSKISNVRQLDENDVDFLIDVGSTATYVELTELVELSFASPMTEDEYKSGVHSNIIVKGNSAIPWRFDPDKRDDALAELVRKKVSKCYAKTDGKPLWLLIFGTFHYSTVYFRDGALITAPAVVKAREYLSQQKTMPFAEIWFTNLQTFPIRIWPDSSDEILAQQRNPGLSSE